MQQRWITGWVVASVLLGPCTSAAAGTPGDSAAVCKRAATKLDGLIVDWHAYVVEFKAEARNPSVLKMLAEHKRGVLKANFRRHCMAQWAQHDDIFTCFAGTVTELGAALCHQTDTNRNHWQYRP
jgi:hypothetical protein